MRVFGMTVWELFWGILSGACTGLCTAFILRWILIGPGFLTYPILTGLTAAGAIGFGLIALLQYQGRQFDEELQLRKKIDFVTRT